MGAKWNLAEVRKLAGMPLTEGWHGDNDDDEDPDVKIVSGDKRQKEFESKNKKHLDDNAAAMKKRTEEQRAAAAKKKEEAKAAKPAEAKKPEEKKAEPAKKEEAKPAPKAEEKKPEEKKPEPAAKKEEPKAEEKKDDAPAEAKRRGAKPNANSKSQRAAAWIKSNPSGTRGQFLAWAKANLDMGAAYGSAFFARHNPKSKRQPQQTNEVFVIVHPHMPSFLLAENREMSQMQWVDPASSLEPMVFESKAEAEKIAKYMSEWKGQASVIQKVVFETV